MTTTSSAATACENIRSTIRNQGVDVDMSAVVRDRGGQRVLRLRPKHGSGISRIVDALTRMAPLAQVTQFTSDVDGSDEVELRFPSKSRMKRNAYSTAKTGCVPWLLWKLAQATILVTVALVMSVLAQHR